MTAPVAILAIADISFRQQVGQVLRNLRWQVLEAGGGAEALAHLEAGSPTAVIVDTWLPDLEIDEFIREVGEKYPDVDLVSADGSFEKAAKSRVGRRGELLHALRVSQPWDGAAFKQPVDSLATKYRADRAYSDHARQQSGFNQEGTERSVSISKLDMPEGRSLEGRDKAALLSVAQLPSPAVLEGLPEFYGTHPRLLEVCRRIRLVAPRKTPVLVQGPSGSGKEIVAKALHRLSPRAMQPLVIINCAAIPESLLEAELFGHTKGAFTGAVHGRSGRIEAANGGTLFLDEIGEMPLSLQAKLLRFLEAGELQRVDDNDIVKVDVRVIAASHQHLARQASQGLFRMDLYFRLAVFLIETPALEMHMEDLPGLARGFLMRLAEGGAAKELTPPAMEKLHQHNWPGNVRELAHVMERAYILAENRTEIHGHEIEFAPLN